MSKSMLSRIDFFRKVPEDLQVQSASGLLFTVISFATMALLLLSHYRAFAASSTRTLVVLDSHQEDRLRINFNVSLLAIPCAYASVDLSDHMGQRFTNVTRHVRHFRLASPSPSSSLVTRLNEVVIDDHARGLPVWGGLDREAHGGIAYSTPLTSASFDDFLRKYELVLVNYYAPWCPYCRSLNPEWERAAAQLQDHPEYSERVRMASVDCTHDDAVNLCRRAHIRAFPTMLIYVYGATSTRYMYNGPRTAEHLLQFLDLFYRRLEPEADFAEEVHIDPEAVLGLPMQVNMQNAGTIAKRQGGKKNTAAMNNDGKHMPLEAVEGCEVSGSLSVNRVPGKLVLTARSTEHSFDLTGVNVSHHVNHFSFGQFRRQEHLVDGGAALQLVPSNRYPLDHATFFAKNQNITVEHFLNVVGFDHEDRRRSRYDPVERVYEFSASSNQYNATNALPAASFTFDISPLVIQVVRDNVPLYHFITSLCAVVGGVFTVIGLVDSGVFYTLKSIQKKQQLGKLH